MKDGAAAGPALDDDDLDAPVEKEGGGSAEIGEA